MTLVTLGRPGFGDRMARIPTPAERLPVVLSAAEVALLLAHAPSLKYRAALSMVDEVRRGSVDHPHAWERFALLIRDRGRGRRPQPGT